MAIPALKGKAPISPVCKVFGTFFFVEAEGINPGRTVRVGSSSTGGRTEGEGLDAIHAPEPNQIQRRTEARCNIQLLGS